MAPRVKSRHRSWVPDLCQHIRKGGKGSVDPSGKLAQTAMVTRLLSGAICSNRHGNSYHSKAPSSHRPVWTESILRQSWGRVRETGGKYRGLPPTLFMHNRVTLIHLSAAHTARPTNLHSPQPPLRPVLKSFEARLSCVEIQGQSSLTVA